MNRKYEFEGAFGGRLEVAEVSDRKWLLITVTDPNSRNAASILIDARSWNELRGLYNIDVRTIEEEISDESPAS
jgi:hypothetical protein